MMTRGCSEAELRSNPFHEEPAYHHTVLSMSSSSSMGFV
jgi:hypothetical protein